MLRLPRMALRCSGNRAIRGCAAQAQAFIDGEVAPAVISMHDLTFIRGDGVFEVVSLLPARADAAVGVPFGWGLHLDRMRNTCTSLRLPMPHSAERVTDWVSDVGKARGPGSCRVLFTRGNPARDVASKCIMLHEPPAQYPAALRLQTVAAPWHFGYALPPLQPGEKEELGLWKTIKWTSYAANCLMTRIAEEQGANDALLLAADGRVLDGPNFAVGFVIDGVLRLVAADVNRMLPSCTQAMAVKAAQAAGLPYREGVVTLDEALRASAGFAMSATRHVMAIAAVDGHELRTDDALLRDLQAAYWRLAEAEVYGE